MIYSAQTWWSSLQEEDLKAITSLHRQNPLLLNGKTMGGYCALHQVCSEGRIDVVALLLSLGADINCQDERGWTPLMHAVCNCHVEVVEMLLHAKANVDTIDFLGNTPLMKASIMHFDDIFDMLLKAEANIFVQNQHTFSAITLACFYGHFDMVKCFLRLHANINELFRFERIVEMMKNEAELQIIVEEYVYDLSHENVQIWKKCRLKGIFN